MADQYKTTDRNGLEIKLWDSVIVRKNPYCSSDLMRYRTETFGNGVVEQITIYGIYSRMSDNTRTWSASGFDWQSNTRKLDFVEKH